MKDYATETDIITTSDPSFYPGDRVEYQHWTRSSTFLVVDSCSWNTLAKSWTYTLRYFISETVGYLDSNKDGSLAVEEALEKEMKLVSRIVAKNPKIKVC